MTPLPQLVHQFVTELPDVQRVILAVSGGVDSMVLLHSAATAQLSLPLLVVHINHQLSPNADQWQQRVHTACTDLGVECLAVAVEVNHNGKGLEAAARTARYEAIEHQLRPGDLVLMAHHRQDQVETFFLRLARGAGVRGLSGMAALRGWGAARLGRPFLGIDRAHIEAYAEEHALLWVEDESNTSERFDRNFLRLQVLPALQQRWPELPTQVGQAMAQLRESDALLGEFAADDILACDPRRERAGVSINIEPLLSWSRSRRQNTIRHWLIRQHYRLPARKRLEELESLLLAREDQNPLLYWGDCELRRYRGRVYCLPANWQRCGSEEASGSAGVFCGVVYRNCTVGGSVELGGGRLQWVSASPGLPPGDYQIVARQYAPQVQRAHPHGRRHSQTLKKLLQEHCLEPWLREQVPLIMQGDRLMAVGDLWIETEAAMANGMAPVWSFAAINTRESD